MTTILSNNYMIPIINKFLTTSELVTVSCVNNKMYNEIKHDLNERKKIFVDMLIYYFYYMDSNECISLCRGYSSYYEIYVRKLFLVLPELFEFIENHNITNLDLSCVTSYGGYPENPKKFIASNDINIILDQLILLIKNNTTLIYCNIGLFENYIHRDKLKLLLHPKLNCISIRANGATSSLNEPPTSLYRMKDGSFVWSHLRSLENS